MGTQLTLPKKGAEPLPQFSAHVRCGQTAGWIKTALGTEVGLGPGHTCARWGTSSPPRKGGKAALPNFSPISIAAKRLDASRCHLVSWYGGRPQPRRLYVRWGPGLLPAKGRSLLIFGPRLLWLNGWMDQYGTWHGGGPWSRPHCSR